MDGCDEEHQNDSRAEACQGGVHATHTHPNGMQEGGEGGASGDALNAAHNHHNDSLTHPHTGNHARASHPPPPFPPPHASTRPFRLPLQPYANPSPSPHAQHNARTSLSSILDERGVNGSGARQEGFTTRSGCSNEAPCSITMSMAFSSGGYRYAWLQVWMVTGMHGYRYTMVTGMHGYRYAWLQVCMVTGMHGYREGKGGGTQAATKKHHKGAAAKKHRTKACTTQAATKKHRIRGCKTTKHHKGAAIQKHCT